MTGRLAKAMLLLAAGAGQARAEIGWNPARTWVFAVGILQWQHSDIYDSFPDAMPNRADRRLVQALQAAGVPEQHVVFLVDHQATLANIRRQLRAHLDRTQEGDLLIFYFAGHGTRDRGTRQTYFANYDAGQSYKSHWPVTEIFDTIEQRFSGERVILLADCCHSGALYDEALKRKDDLACACLTSVYSHNLSTGNWTFTEALLKGFTGSPLADADADGRVTLRETAAYAERDMAFLEQQKAMFLATGGIEPDLVLADTRGQGAAGLGRYVEVQWKGKWYSAQVIGLRGEQARVHYAGYGNDWDEWVPPERIRQPAVANLAKGTRVSVLWDEDQQWYPATVTASQYGLAKVRYDGYSHEWDEWVGPRSIKVLKE